MNKIVYLTYPALFAILVIGSRWFKKDQWNDEYMSLTQTKYLQGFIAICIMLHHIGQETCARWQNYPLFPGLEVFVPIGYWFVAVFMFCSGFGLYKSYQKKPDYLKGFFKKRVLPLVVAFYTTGLIFFAARIIMKEPMNGIKVFYYITGLGMPNPNSWFVIAMPYFYLCFYLSFKFFKKEGLKIAGVIFGVFIYTFLGTWLNHNSFCWMRGEWWYNCVHLLWIGLLFGKYESKITEKLKKHFVLYLILAIVLTYVFYILSEIAQGVFGYYGEYNPNLTHIQVVMNRWVCLISQMLASAFFVFSIIILGLKMKIGNKLLGFMGTITLEFYLIHGLFLEFFSYRFCDIVPSIVRITNVALLIVIVFALSVPAAYGLKKLHNLICRSK